MKILKITESGDVGRRIDAYIAENTDVTRSQIQKMLEKGTKSFILGHISEENNLPELAFWQTTTALDKMGASIDKDYKLIVSLQREVSEKVKS